MKILLKRIRNSVEYLESQLQWVTWAKPRSVTFSADGARIIRGMETVPYILFERVAEEACNIIDSETWTLEISHLLCIYTSSDVLFSFIGCRGVPP